ncbi:hypothetical protein PV11_03241 [Exophiala sideris]|uniref:Azaphilone pigments biosynthesis cluster protein L N-terminal domain-containing protein n=1 Tax=Exophiala sideris TaxID=1016849 RepID=A0A0D1YYM6_9EURO|nr:hypothetical protein PV11_03241 [Exophiala sideris]
MADPLSISASVAGLITIADAVIRNGYRYVKAATKARKVVAALVNEVNLLSGTLHSLQNVVESLETEAESRTVTTKSDHFDTCYQTLRKVNILLDKFVAFDSKRTFHTMKRQLEWPLKAHETEELISEIKRHRATLSLALQADELYDLRTHAGRLF